MDAVDPAIVDEHQPPSQPHPRCPAVTSTQVRWLGHRLVADLTIDVDPDRSVDEGHQIATATHRRLIGHVAHVDDVHVHVHPYQSASEASTHR